MAEIIFQELEKKLKIFDYTYMMSDDHRCWVSGEAQLKIVDKMIQDCAEIDKEKTEDLITKYKQEYGTQFCVDTCDCCYEVAKLEKMGNKKYCPECWDNARCDAEHEAAHGRDD